MASISQGSLILEPVNGSNLLCQIVATAGGLSQGAFSEQLPLEAGAWYGLTLTMDDSEHDNRITLYINGIKSASFMQKRISCLQLTDAENCFLGHGPFSYTELKADLTNITIFPNVLPDSTISELFSISDEARVSFDRDGLTIDRHILTEALNLPVLGTYGSAFCWHSSMDTVLDASGKVNRPAPGSAPAYVTLTAAICCGTAKTEKEFSFTVPALPTVEELLQSDLDAISLPDPQLITCNINPPDTGKSGSRITWASSRPGIITADGRVTRPEAVNSDRGIPVILTATARVQDVTVEKDFEVKVIPVSKEIGIADIESIRITVNPNCAVPLPAAITVRLEDATFKRVHVIWPEIHTAPASRGRTVVIQSMPEGSSHEVLVAPGTELTIYGRLTRINRSIPAKMFFADKAAAVNEAVSTHTRGHHPMLRQVRLAGNSIFTQNRDRCLAYLKLLDCDRMLYDFRMTFGEDTLGAIPPGGWDEPSSLLRGHSTGHFLSALALAYGSDNDAEILAQINYIVNELSRLQDLCEGEAHNFVTSCTPTNAAQTLWSRDYSTWGRGYISVYSPDQFALLEQFTPYATIRAPYYTLHKLLAGLLDCYRYADSLTALKVASGIGDWVHDRLNATTAKQRSRMWSMYIACEYGGMNGSLAALARLTGNSNYLETACYFDNPRLFDGLSIGLDTISGIHANQHIPQIIGALEEYRVTKDIKYYNIARAFWKIVTEHYAYSIGGVGRGEVFIEPDILAGNKDSDRSYGRCHCCRASFFAQN